MKRTYTATGLVKLPKLDATAAQTLGTAVLSTARAILADKAAAKKIHEPVIEAVEELAIALDALNRLAATRLPIVTTDETPRARAADVVVDAVWSGLQDVLIGWSKIPGLPEAEIASSLRAMLFPDKLRFTQLAFKLEWAESNTRILVIKEKELEPQIKKLGAGKILERLYEAHKEYGEALGITSPAEVAAEPEETLGDALAEVSEALRTYVVRVSGMKSKKDAVRTELANRLLQPIESWETPSPRPSTAEAPTEAEPQPGPGPEGATKPLAPTGP